MITKQELKNTLSVIGDILRFDIVPRLDVDNIGTTGFELEEVFDEIKGKCNEAIDGISSLDLAVSSAFDLIGSSTIVSPELGVEKLTEYRHIDGKPIYTQYVDFGALPNKALKGVAYNADNVDMHWLDLSKSYSNRSDKKISLTLDNNFVFVDTYSQPDGVYLHTSGNYSGYNNTVVAICYTKTTDTAYSPVATVGNTPQRATIASANSAGIKGMICYDDNYLYVCVANNSWKRIELIGW